MASVFSSEQIDQYLEYIELPSRFRRAANPPIDLEFLTALVTYHLARVPYDNLSLHYSPTHKNSINPIDVFEKVVTNARGRGGYCMESSIFFNHMLRALGFDAYTAGAKIRYRVDGIPQGDYSGWVHLVNIVTFTTPTNDGGEPVEQKYMVDVAFGGDGATKPLPMIHENAIQNLGSQEIRLAHTHIPAQNRQKVSSQKFWVYQYRNKPEQPWNSFFAFPELEFSEHDFEVMNWYTGYHPESFQTYTTILVKFLRRPPSSSTSSSEPIDEIYGKLMLVNGDIKRNLGGRTEVIKVCTTEEERIQALKEYFDMTFTPEEIEGNVGRVTELGRTVEGTG